MVGNRRRLVKPALIKKSLVRGSSQSLTLGVVAIVSSATLAVAAATFIAADWSNATITGGTPITDQNIQATLDASSSGSFPSSGSPDITVVAEVSGTGVGFFGFETLATRGGAAGMFFDDGLVSAPALAFLSTSTADPNDPTKHCVPSEDCTDNEGFITLTFSEPVSNPVLSFSGLGGFSDYNSGSRVLASWAELEFVPHDSLGAQGITRLTGTTGFVVDGDSITVDGDLPSSNCVSTSTFDNGTTTPAGCGSIVVNGDSVDKIVFRTYLRSTGGFRNTASSGQPVYEDSGGVVFDRAANRPFVDGWSLAVSINHAFPSETDASSDLRVKANPQTQTIPANQSYSGSAVVARNTGSATYKAVSEPSFGTVVMQADGSFVYTPNAGFTGTDAFLYELCHPDDKKVCARSTITLIVTSANLLARTGGELPPFWAIGVGLLGVGAATYLASVTVRRPNAVS